MQITKIRIALDLIFPYKSLKSEIAFNFETFIANLTLKYLQEVANFGM